MARKTPTTFFVKAKASIEIKDVETQKRLSELEKKGVVPCVYVPYKVSHNFYKNPAIKEACNVLQYEDIVTKTAILNFSIGKNLPPEIAAYFTITFKRINDQQIKKRIRLVACTLDTSIDRIAENLFAIKKWRINETEYDMEQVLGPKERITFKTGII